ncbi:MAG: hypothetical protein ABH816_01270 [Candidatus Levyibacteriota bacterium]
MKNLALTIGDMPIPLPTGLATINSVGSNYILEHIIWLGLNLLLILAVILSLFFMIWAGIQWTSSGGNKESLQKARQKLIYAIIGLVVVFLAFFIRNFIGKFFLLDPLIGVPLP